MRWALLVASVAVLLFGRRAALLLVAAVAATFLDQTYNHMLFGFWTILTWALFPDLGQRRLVHRCQLTILYGFAGVSKLTARWLSGAGMLGVIEFYDGSALVPASLARPAAIAAVVVELTLAAGVWFPRARIGVLTLGTGLHLGLAALGGSYSQPLLFFNGLALLWLWDATRAGDVDEAGRRRPEVATS